MAVCDLWKPVLQVFVIDNVLKLLENLDPSVPYFITDHLWYPQPGECCMAILLCTQPAVREPRPLYA